MTSRVTYEIESFPVGAFQCNCSLLAHPETRDAMVIDPGDDLEAILERIDYHELRVRALWHTHAHIDHIGATKTLFEEISRRNRELGVEVPKVYLHEADRWLYDNVGLQASFLGLYPFEVTSELSKLTDGQNYAGFEGVRARHTPGHTPGSCCLDVRAAAHLSVPRSFRAPSGDDAKTVVITGDTLFRGSIGRTDLWGGDTPTILKSIRDKLLTLDEEAVVVPGHGPLTTIGHERAKNPFFAAGR